MKKRKETPLFEPNESMWELSQYSLREPIPVLHHRFTRIAFEKIAHKILYAPEFSQFPQKWKNQTESSLQGKTLPVVIPTTFVQGEPVNVFVILPQIGELVPKEYWKRDVLVLKLDTKFILRTFVENR